MSEAFIAPAAVVEAPAKRGRPAKYASAAERQKAWRAAHAVKTVALDGKIAPTVESLAVQFDCSESHVLNNLLRYALANRNWRGLGIGGWAKADARFTTGKRSAPVERDDSFDSFSLA